MPETTKPALDQALGVAGLSSFLGLLLIAIIKFVIEYILENMDEFHFDRADAIKKIGLRMFLNRIKTNVSKANFKLSDLYESAKDGLNMLPFGK